MPPVYSKVNPADAPIVTMAITSATLPLPKVQDLVDTRLAQKLSQLPGVGLVSIGGGQRPAIRIQANSKALAASGLNLDDIRIAIGNANVNIAKGSFDGAARASTLDANDELKSAEEYRNLIIAWRNGAPIRLSDIAETIDGAENTHLAAWSDQNRAVILNIQHQPGPMSSKRWIISRRFCRNCKLRYLALSMSKFSLIERLQSVLRWKMSALS